MYFARIATENADHARGEALDFGEGNKGGGHASEHELGS